MAITQLDELKALVGETIYTDEELTEILIATGSVNGAAAYVWRSKVTSSVGMVDISESGSSRKMSDVYNQNLSMAEYYAGLAENEGTVGGMRRGKVNYIERP